jgi:3-isopropylmalate dehydrogenase
MTGVAGLSCKSPSGDRFVVGVLEGEGVGPQLTRICIDILEAISICFGRVFDVRYGGAIGLDALKEQGTELPNDVCSFCEAVFADGGAILAGPGGGRFVYDMRRQFDLFVKLNPLERHAELDGDGALPLRTSSPLNMVVVRENMGGLYQGQATRDAGPAGREVKHSFSYTDSQVTRVTDVAARVAASRSGRLTVVAKNSGLPELTDLWFECAKRSARDQGVSLKTLDIDYGVYALVTAPEQFDVIVAPNCFGDILADLGGVFCGSRGTTFGGSYSGTGAAVYQTNHGAAYDLAGTDTANPVGQMLSLAMMLRETFGLGAEANAIVHSVRACWAQGWRTADLMSPGRRVATTSEFGRRVVDHIRHSADVAAAV